MTGIFSVFFLMIRRPPRSTLFPYHDALPISVYQVKSPVGFVDGSAPSTVEFPLSPPLTELYWGFWWKPSNPFQSHRSGVNKIAFIWTPSGSTDLLYFDLSPNPWRIRCMNDLYTGH